MDQQLASLIHQRRPRKDNHLLLRFDEVALPYYLVCGQSNMDLLQTVLCLVGLRLGSISFSFLGTSF